MYDSTTVIVEPQQQNDSMIPAKDRREFLNHRKKSNMRILFRTRDLSIPFFTGETIFFALQLPAP